MTVALFVIVLMLPATVAAGYYFALTALGWRRRAPALPAEPTTRFTVLIPAHDEETTLPGTLAAVVASDYPTGLLRLVVVADNCSDGTAAVARRHGAEALERIDPRCRGKGYALAFALPEALASEPDAVLLLDADSRPDPAALRVLDAELRAGARAVQAAVCYVVRPDDGPTGLVAAVGSEIENGIQAGLDALGGSAWLRGTGMAFRHELLSRFPWESFGLTEDAEYSDRLRAAGVRVRFAAGAVMRSDPPPGDQELLGQRRRWRAALRAGGKDWLDRVVASKPLVLGHLGLAVAGCGLNGSAWALAWAGVLIGLTAAVYLRAILRVGGTASAARHLWRLPGLVLRLAVVTATGFLRPSGAWERTARAVTTSP